jgi:hypothetical protein
VLDPQNPGAEIPSDFAGLSFEMQRVLPDTNRNHFFSADNQRHRIVAGDLGELDVAAKHPSEPGRLDQLQRHHQQRRHDQKRDQFSAGEQPVLPPVQSVKLAPGNLCLEIT